MIEFPVVDVFLLFAKEHRVVARGAHLVVISVFKYALEGWKGIITKITQLESFTLI